jgi:3,4-dihydroxy 2-butanone 4-phosphate synthase/GTP cyclohydrolase II
VSLTSMDDALRRIRRGEMVLVVDDEDRENEGDLTLAAEWVTPEAINFMMRWARGLVCMPCSTRRLDDLDIGPMVPPDVAGCDTAFTVSVDHRDAGSGIGAQDRALTIRKILDPASRAEHFVRPGHVFPLRAREGGVLERRGHTEAAVDLARLAGLRPAGAIVEIAGEDGRMLRLPELIPFARKHGLTIISIEDLVAYRRSAEPTVRREAETRLPTAFGTFTAYGYRSIVDGVEHVALVHGDIGADDGEDVLVRVHSECLTGDVFHSLRCDCGPQLETSLERIRDEGRGVVVYLRGHEGRGIGLLSKLRAYELQEQGHDTLDANLELGLPADARDYGAGAQILQDLGVRSVRLMTNNPDKTDALVRHGLRVTGREPMPVQAGEHNLRYLRSKRDRMGHDLPWLDTAPVSPCGNQ